MSWLSRAAPVLAEIFDQAESYEDPDPWLLHKAVHGLSDPAIDPECAHLRRIAEHHADKTVRGVAFLEAYQAPHCEMLVRPDAYKRLYP